ncbi:MAG: extracellular solute-binding protein [Roseburia sp.]|nr:extracellular solute-binding protein [Roseburia sp.]
MKGLKKLLALGLSATMVLGLAACGGSSDAPANNASDSSASANNTAAADNSSSSSTEIERPTEKRIITIGTWYDHYYTSDHTSIEDNPDVTDVEIAQMQLDNMRAIEEKYNVELRFVNLTWDGTIESINTSIMAGQPDCDIYETDVQFGVPAAFNGYAAALEDFLPADADVLTDKQILKPLDIGTDKTYLFKVVSLGDQLGGYPLGFNMDMINEAGLENPQDLWDRGEWTWDKFEEYCIALTKDTDGDGVTDVYGYGGWWTNMLANLLMSNGATIAAGATETLSSPETGEVLNYINTLYNVDKCARPWDPDDWDSNNSCYKTGEICFFIAPAWTITPDELNFEFGVVPWPVGPNGNKDTNNGMALAGNAYMIANGVEDPAFVYQVFEDWNNWYDGDTELRDDVEWFENQMVTERNYEYLLELGQREQFDLWQTISVENFNVIGMLAGEVTPAQLQEQAKQEFQTGLDAFFK